MNFLKKNLEQNAEVVTKLLHELNIPFRVGLGVDSKDKNIYVFGIHTLDGQNVDEKIAGDAKSIEGVLVGMSIALNLLKHQRSTQS